jgi:pyrroline-5-carboxylate reductase
MQLPSPTWFVGCGNMAGAMVEGWRSAGLDLSQAVAIRPSGKPVEGVRTVTSLRDAGAAPSMIVLGFKPQQLDEVVAELTPWITSKTIIVSLLAGAEIASMRRRFPKGLIVRTIPNLPVSVRRGVVPLYSEEENEVRDVLSELFSVLGFSIWCEDESKLVAIGAAAGAGPAYVARFVEALAEAGEAQGLSPAIAETVALETVLGTAWRARTTGETMEDLARRVASPRGTTEAGLAVLDRGGALENLVSSAIDAARRRGAELAAEARGEQVA